MIIEEKFKKIFTCRYRYFLAIHNFHNFCHEEKQKYNYVYFGWARYPVPTVRIRYRRYERSNVLHNMHNSKDWLSHLLNYLAILLMGIAYFHSVVIFKLFFFLPNPLSETIILFDATTKNAPGPSSTRPYRCIFLMYLNAGPGSGGGSMSSPVRDSPLLMQEVQDMRAAVVCLQSNMARYGTGTGHIFFTSSFLFS